VNLYEVETARDEDDAPGYETASARIGPLIGATDLGATVYDLAPGQSVCPYHYEYGFEEWLIVLTGNPILRDPDGEHQLAPGDVVLFPEGPDGAHNVTNRTDEPVRIAIASNKGEPGVAVYPDSGKVGVWPLNKIFRLADAVDYWDGEL
jgi:uncharacterized cupin superfamily protein